MAFVLLGITYFNLRLNLEAWTTAGDFPSVLHGLSAMFWFDMVYVTIAIAFVVLVIVHRRCGLPVIPETWLGAGELLYVLDQTRLQETPHCSRDSRTRELPFNHCGAPCEPAPERHQQDQITTFDPSGSNRFIECDCN